MPFLSIAGPGSRHYPSAEEGGTDFSQLLLSDDFQAGTVGQPLSGNGGYHTSHAFYSDDIVGPSGLPKVVSCVATEGAEENALGFYCTLPGGLALTGGDEIWIRIKWFMPVGSDYNASTYALKFLRAHVLSSTAVHQGYDDLYLNRPVTTDAWIHQSELFGDNDFFGAGSHPQYGVWNTVEFNVRFGHTPTSVGGLGRMRTWFNGVFLHETDWQETLNNATDECLEVLWVTYWNGTVPVTQTWYCADFAIAARKDGVRDDTVHLSTDSGGRKFIGIGSP
jgi:hypothetical protein